MGQVKRTNGLHGAYIAKIGTGGTYETPMELNIEDFTAQEVLAEGMAYSNNEIDTEVKEIKAYDVNMTLAQMTPKMEALFRGSDTSKGGVTINTKDTAPRFGLIIVQTHVGGSKTANIYYNCSLAPESTAGKTKTESLEFGNVPIKGRAIPVEGGFLARKINDADEEIDKEKFDAIFTTFPTPDTDFKKAPGV